MVILVLISIITLYTLNYFILVSLMNVVTFKGKTIISVVEGWLLFGINTSKIWLSKEKKMKENVLGEKK